MSIATLVAALGRRQLAVAATGVAALAMLGATSWRAVGGPGTASGAAAEARSVVVGPARLEPVSGEVDISADIVGVIGQLPVREGDRVKAGDLLAQTNNRDVAARVDQARANVRMQKARLERVRNGARAEERRQATAAIDEQDATFRRQKADLDRQKSLFSRGFASSAQMEQAEAAYRVALARRSSTSEALAQMTAGARPEDIASAEAELDFAQGQLAEAQAALERTQIRAPFDGVVLRLYKRVGEAVSPTLGPSILQIGDVSRLVARTQIDEADIARVTRNAKATLRAAGYPGQVFYGRVTDISPRLGARTIYTGAPAEKRDATVLDVLVTLDPGTALPIGLRLDCYIETAAPS